MSKPQAKQRRKFNDGSKNEIANLNIIPLIKIEQLDDQAIIKMEPFDTCEHEEMYSNARTTIIYNAENSPIDDEQMGLISELEFIKGEIEVDESMLDDFRSDIYRESMRQETLGEPVFSAIDDDQNRKLRESKLENAVESTAESTADSVPIQSPSQSTSSVLLQNVSPLPGLNHSPEMQIPGGSMRTTSSELVQNVSPLPELDRPSVRPSITEISQQTSPTFFERYTFASNEPINIGEYSICMRCKINGTDSECAVKILRLDPRNDVEIDALSKCDGHPNVAEILDVVKDDHFVFIVMELMAGESLLSYVKRKHPLDENFVRKIFIQIARGLSYIHSKQFIHRDLCMKNIRLSGEGNVKILEFSSAAEIITNSQKIFLHNAPPEMLTKEMYEKEADVWCLGILLFEMLMGYHPFCSNATSDQARNRTINCNIQFNYYRMPPLSPSAMHLIKCLLEPDPVHRIQSDKMVEHSWCCPGQNERIVGFITESGRILQLEELSSIQKTELIKRLTAAGQAKQTTSRQTISNESLPHAENDETDPKATVAVIPEKKYVCQTCHKGFNTKRIMNRHTMIHQGLKFICEEENCTKMFSQRGKLSRHIKNQHNREITSSERIARKARNEKMEEKKKITCEICNAKFIRKSTLKKHTALMHSERT